MMNQLFNREILNFSANHHRHIQFYFNRIHFSEENLKELIITDVFLSIKFTWTSKHHFLDSSKIPKSKMMAYIHVNYNIQ